MLDIDCSNFQIPLVACLIKESLLIIASGDCLEDGGVLQNVWSREFMECLESFLFVTIERRKTPQKRILTHEIIGFDSTVSNYAVVTNTKFLICLL